jgi:hypothetical protein
MRASVAKKKRESEAKSGSPKAGRWRRAVGQHESGTKTSRKVVRRKISTAETQAQESTASRPKTFTFTHHSTENVTLEVTNFVACRKDDVLSAILPGSRSPTQCVWMISDFVGKGLNAGEPGLGPGSRLGKFN